MGLAKTAFQQYVLEHCAVTGLAFTSGCDGTIQSFAIDTCKSSGDGEQPQQHVLVTATPVGKSPGVVVENLLGTIQQQLLRMDAGATAVQYLRASEAKSRTHNNSRKNRQSSSWGTVS